MREEKSLVRWRVQALQLQLQLSGEAPRNWEGLVRLDERGFLLVTDKFSGTLLGFVPGPGPAEETAQEFPT